MKRLFAVTAMAVALASGAAASAAYLSTATGEAAGRSAAPLGGTTPSASVANQDVTVSWQASSFPHDGTVATAYRVRRYDSTTLTEATVGAGCAAIGDALTCTERSVPAGSWMYTVTPTYLSWTGVESTRSSPAVVATATTDNRSPQRTAMTIHDDNANGRFDRISVTFDEALAPYSAGTTPWTLSNLPADAVLHAVSVSGSTATLTLAEGVSTTAVGGITVALAAHAAGIRDAAGNQSSFIAAAPTDKAGPVVTNLALEPASTQNSGAGKIDNGDRVKVTYSEPLAPASVCPTWDTGTRLLGPGFVVEVSTTDVLTVRGATCTPNFGSLALRADYVTQSASFSGSSNGNKDSQFELAQDAKSISVKIGDHASGTLVTVTAAHEIEFTPSTAVTDVAGNAGAATPLRSTGQRF